MKSVVLMTGVLAATMVLTVAGVAQGKPLGYGPRDLRMGAGMEGLRVLLELKFTPGQQAQVLNILSHFEDQRDGLVSGLREAKKDVAAALETRPFDEDAARKAFQRASAVRVELLVLRAKAMSEIKAILTPEQLALLEERKAQRRVRMKALQACPEHLKE